MQLDAKLELAHAIIDTYRAREESFIPEDRRYAKSYWETAIETVADPDLRDLVPNMLAWSREHVEWAETLIERNKAG